MRIGFIGLGNMGAGIAANLLRAGHELTIWNRTAQKADALVALGATLAGSPHDAAASGEICFSILADDAALRSVLAGERGLLAGLQPGAIHISLSTISVAMSEDTALQHAERGQHYIAAPVFGRPDAAAAGKLFIVAGGRETDLERVKHLFEAIGQRVFHIDAVPAHANLVKLCGNFMILSAIEAMGEAMTLADRGGVAKTKLLEVLTGTLFDTPLYRNYGGSIVKDQFRPAGFAAPLGLKDMRLVGEAASTVHVPMPLADLLRAHLQQVIDADGADVDWSAIAHATAQQSGA
jgi:3-hydroxyisobutyrate dehydrogenase-like beta-hydroxyacid dehydrogenase